MDTNLDKDDLVALVKGTSPNYSAMDHPLVAANGWFNGSLGQWNWNWNLNKLTEEQLYDVYTICKNSWKENVK